MGLDWQVTSVRSVTDGDSFRADLTREVPLVDGWAATIHNVNPPAGPQGVPLRLITVDTPETGTLEWRVARQELTAWVAARVGRLRVETFTSAGWGRDLADLYAAGDRSDTASQHMLRLGWPPYLPG